MGYYYRAQFNLRYTEMDFKDELKPSALLGLAQEAASKSADELCFGYSDLQPNGYGFILVNTYCKVLRPIRLGEMVSVETWPLPPRLLVCERDYCVKDGEGDVICALASRWCLVDLNSFRIISPEKLGKAHQDCPYNPEKSVEVPSWRIKRLNGEGKEVGRIKISPSHCDHYMHANNTKYADFFLDCFTMQELNRQIESFQITYAKQAKEGEELVFYRKDEGNVSTLEAYRGEELISQFQITFMEILL